MFDLFEIISILFLDTQFLPGVSNLFVVIYFLSIHILAELGTEIVYYIKRTPGIPRSGKSVEIAKREIEIVLWDF